MLFVIFLLGLACANAQESFPVVSIETPVVVNQEISADLPLPAGSGKCLHSSGELPDGLTLTPTCRLVGTAVQTGNFGFSVRFGEARKRNIRIASFEVKVRTPEPRLAPAFVYFAPPEQSWMVRHGVLRRGQVVRVDSVEGPISAQIDYGRSGPNKAPTTEGCFDELASTRLLVNGETARGALCSVAGLTAYFRVPADLAGPTATLQLVGTDADGRPTPTNVLTLPVE